MGRAGACASDLRPGPRTRFAILGPLAVTHGDIEITVPQLKPRTLLATLLLHANEIVSADWLAETLWEGRPPATARTALQNHVLRLRRALGTSVGLRVRTRSPGYLIEVREGELDWDRFTGLRDLGRGAARRGEWAEAARLLRAALDQWAGEPLADLRLPAQLAAGLREMTEARLQAVEWRIDAELRLGGHTDLVAELAHLAAAQPLRERIHEQLMLALYRDGRAAEALVAYQQVRAVLRAELGVEPGAGIQWLHQRMLAADPALPWSAPSATPAAAPVYQLPAYVPDFTGRAGERAQLQNLLTGPAATASVPVAVISGPPGAGKSALALRVAHAVRGAFPDGQLYVQLTDAAARPREAGEVLGELLRGLGVGAAAIPEAPAERAALYRSRLADRKILLVADDAQSPGQVRPLLPGMPGCAVIVTSRSRLTAVSGAQFLAIECMSPADAVEMLGRIIGTRRVLAEPEAADRLTAACGWLPLAIRIAGARLAARPAWPIATLARLITGETHRLDELVTADLEVRASVALSYESLDPAARRAFRLLGLLGPHDVAEWVVAALLGQRGAAAEVNTLADKSLLTPAGVDATGEPRYRLHDLLRDYAAERLASEPPAGDPTASEPLTGERVGRDTGSAGALGRVLTGFLELADRADGQLPRESFFPPPARLAGPAVIPAGLARRLTADPVTWFRAERLNLLAATGWACATGRVGLARELAVRQAGFQYREGRFDDGEQLWRMIAAAAAGTADPRELALAEFWLSAVLADRGRHADALPALERCTDAFDRLGDLSSLVLCRYLRALCAQSLDLNKLCCAETSRGLALARRLGDRRAEGLHLRVLGLGLAGLGLPWAGVRRCGQALAIARELTEPDREIQALYSLAQVTVAAGQHRAAAGLCRDGLSLCRLAPATAGTPYYLRLLGTAYRGLGQPAAAVPVLTQALQIFEDRGEGYGEATCLLELGELQLAAGQTGQALGHLERSLMIAGELGLSSIEARARRAVQECGLAQTP